MYMKDRKTFGRIGELMLNYLRINSPQLKINSLYNLEVKLGDDDLGPSGSHYVVEVMVGIRDANTPMYWLFDTYVDNNEEKRKCYVNETAFKAFVNQQNNIVWDN